MNEELATKGDVERAVTTLRQEMATKQDLEQAVTTLRQEMATKQDLEQAVTTLRQEMATKQDLEQSVTTLRQEMSTKQDLAALRQDFEAHRAATKQDLEQSVSQAVIMLRGEMADLRKELRGEMGALKTELRGEMGALKDEIVREFRIEGAKIANTMVEQLRAQVNVVEEKYQDLPPSHAKLREDFDAHASDTRIHARVPGSLPRRARRPRSS